MTTAPVIHTTVDVDFDVEEVLAPLRAQLRELGRLVVAFSGGADSAFLAWVANDTLGAENVQCVTALSPSLSAEEEADCRALATEWQLRWRGIPTDEMTDPRYVSNSSDRCAHCKTALMSVAGSVAEDASATVVLGVNMDDLGDHRPGQEASAALGAVFPLVLAGFTKELVRSTSKLLGLRTWDKPAAACLASRIPYGTPVTLATLDSVARAESSLRRFGLREFRVRHHGNVARVEVVEEAMAFVMTHRKEIVEMVRSAGYVHVSLDLEGFRSGSLNRALPIDDANRRASR